MKIRLIFLAFGMKVVSLVLSCVSVAYPSWINVAEKTFGLVTCTNCMTVYKDWTLECFARFLCETNSASCDFYIQVSKSGSVLILLETIFILFTLLALSKLLSILLNRVYDSYFYLLILLFTGLLLKLSGTLYWSISTASASGPGYEFVGGLKFNIFSIAWEILTISLIVWSTMNIPKAEGLFCVRSKRFGVSRKAWIIISALLLLFGTFLSMGSLSDAYWVDKGLQGTLMRCENCNMSPWMAWQCLSSSECEANSDSELCSDYSSFARAGNLYLVLSMVSVLCILTALDTIFSYLFMNIYGFFQVSTVLLFVSTLFQAIGTFYWIRETGINTNASCSQGYCAAAGVILAVLSFVLEFLGTVIFVLGKPEIGFMPIAETKRDIIEREENEGHIPQSNIEHNNSIVSHKFEEEDDHERMLRTQHERNNSLKSPGPAEVVFSDDSHQLIETNNWIKEKDALSSEQ